MDLLNWPDGVIDKDTIDVSNPTRFGNVVLGDSIKLGMTTMDEMKELVQSIRNAFGITLVGPNRPSTSLTPSYNMKKPAHFLSQVGGLFREELLPFRGCSGNFYT